MSDFYNGAAEGYDELYSEEQLRKIWVIKDVLNPSADDFVLDVGCGTGLSKELGCKVIGIDPSEGLIRQASIPAVKGVAEALPFKDKSFDSVVCITAIHNFTDPEKAIKEMARVSRGRIVISLLKKSGSFAEIAQLIRSNLDVEKEVDEEKDSIFVCIFKKYK